MTIRFADAGDIPALVKLRFDFLAAEPEQAMPDSQKTRFRTQYLKYYENHLNHDFYAAVAEENGIVVSVSFLVIQEKPANVNFPTGKTGLILNVFTYPEHRRRGYAAETLKLLIEKANHEALSYLELSATEAGAYVYRKLGFIEKKPGSHTEMRLSLLP